MSSVRGRWRNGKVELEGTPPADWPEGAEVETRLSETAEEVPAEDPSLTGTDPESVARWEAYFDSLKQFQMSDEDYAEFNRVLEEYKHWELANWEKYQERIRGLFP